MKEVVEDGNDLMSQLSSAISDAMSAMEGIAEMMDDAIENQLNGLDAVNDKIEYQQNMMEIVYGDQSSAAQVQLLNLQCYFHFRLHHHTISASYGSLCQCHLEHLFQHVYRCRYFIAHRRQ